MIKKITSKQNNPPVPSQTRGYFKRFNALRFIGLLLAVFIFGCKKDDFKDEIVGLCPVVVSTDPTDKAVDVVLDKLISATFNTNMEPATINKTTFTIKQGTTLIAGTVAPTATGTIFTFKPDVPLLPFTTYTGTISTGATDPFRTAMVADYVWTFTTIPEIKLSSNPAAGGTLTGAGMFAQGSTVTVTATPLEGYTFTNWTHNGTITSTSASYPFAMAGNRALVANYTLTPPSQLAVILSSNPAAGGTTNGAGNYNAGSSVTVTANANAGFTFLNWTENGNVVSANPSYQFMLTADRNLVAHYNPIPASQLTLALSANPTVGGNTNGAGSFNAGSSVTVTAAANTGYTFTNWTEGNQVVSTSASYTFALNDSKTLVANFAIKTYTLTVTAANGTVAKSLDQARYNHGSTVQLTATPNPGFTFTSWSGDAVGDTNPLTVTMNADKNITANFTAIPPVVNAYTLTVTAANGTVVKNPNQPNYNAGTNVQLTATANAGYIFTSWSGDATGSVNPLTVTMNANKNITANFTPIPAVGPQPINLGTAGDFSILTKAGISTTGITSVEGNIGVSPAAATAITGFGLIMDTDGESSHTPIVTGKVYASDYAAPTPAKMTTAVNDMETAFTTANGLTTPAPIVNLYAGDISGRILPAGLYKWSTGVLISNAGVSLTGGPNDVWVFQISENLTVNNGAIITLLGGAKAENIFWVVSGQATLGSDSDLSGNILSKTLISLNTGAKVTGKLLAQTAVTLNASTVKKK